MEDDGEEKGMQRKIIVYSAFDNNEQILSILPLGKLKLLFIHTQTEKIAENEK